MKIYYLFFSFFLLNSSFNLKTDSQFFINDYENRNTKIIDQTGKGSDIVNTNQTGKGSNNSGTIYEHGGQVNPISAQGSTSANTIPSGGQTSPGSAGNTTFDGILQDSGGSGITQNNKVPQGTAGNQNYDSYRVQLLIDSRLFSFSILLLLINFILFYFSLDLINKYFKRFLFYEGFFFYGVSFLVIFIWSKIVLFSKYTQNNFDSFIYDLEFNFIDYIFGILLSNFFLVSVSIFKFSLIIFDPNYEDEENVPKRIRTLINNAIIGVIIGIIIIISNILILIDLK